jgi:hypothetical protein
MPRFPAGRKTKKRQSTASDIAEYQAVLRLRKCQILLEHTRSSFRERRFTAVIGKSAGRCICQTRALVRATTRPSESIARRKGRLSGLTVAGQTQWSGDPDY